MYPRGLVSQRIPGSTSGPVCPHFLASVVACWPATLGWMAAHGAVHCRLHWRLLYHIVGEGTADGTLANVSTMNHPRTIPLLYSVCNFYTPCPLYPLLCTLYSLLCKLYSVPCILYPVLCTLYTLYCPARARGVMEWGTPGQHVSQPFIILLPRVQIDPWFPYFSGHTSSLTPGCLLSAGRSACK